jgi:uncharacterized protein YjbI with pentapeptide repeats
MAKPEQLDKLLDSVEVWNEWRYENFEIVPALWGAYLKEADLRGADLREVDLEESELSGADISCADLRGANLRDAVLRGANLSGADFDRTDLKRADLGGANLMGARTLETEQLCKTKTLFQAEMDPDLENEVWYERSHLLEKPKENTGL